MRWAFGAVLVCGCINWGFTRQEYCQAQAESGRPGLCVGGERFDGGDGTALTAEGPGPGQIAWGRRCGGPGEERALALASSGAGELFVAGTFTGKAELCAGSAVAAGGTDLFVLRVDASGEGHQLVVGQSAGDEEATALAYSPDGLYVGGSFSAPVTFDDAGPFDAGVAVREGFISMLVSQQVRAWVQLSSGASGESRITRLAMQNAAAPADRRLVALGWFRGALSVGGGPPLSSPRTRPTAFVLLFDPSLVLKAWVIARPGCEVSWADDVALRGTDRVTVFIRLKGPQDCGFGTMPWGRDDVDTRPARMELQLNQVGELSPPPGAVSVATAPEFPHLGTVTAGLTIHGVTQGSAGSSVAHLELPSTQLQFTRAVSRVDALTSGPSLAYAAFAYQSDGLTSFEREPLPPRARMSPLFFAVNPNMGVTWIRPLDAAGRFAVHGLLHGSNEVIAAGDFEGFIGTGEQTLRSAGGADLFLVSFRAQ